MSGTPSRSDEEASAAAKIDDMLIGKSASIIALREMISRVARSSASVMITGASGTGKDVVARAIHAASPRSDKPYIALNCGAIPTDLIESELFGHERGAFTGAQARRAGHFENADRGTLFLDEIGDMRFDMQVKLLRVLEDGQVSRVGASGSFPVDVRIISATNQNIERAIARKQFREDLFFRLGVVVVMLPSLAERIEDLPLLIAHFQKNKSPHHIGHFDRSALQRLMQHDWPGNVRELRNIVERANVLFGGETIDRDGVDQLFGNVAVRPMVEQFVPKLALVKTQIGSPIDLRAKLEQIEFDHIRAALLHTNGVISEAARLLTLKRTTLIEKMRKHHLEKIAA